AQRVGAEDEPGQRLVPEVLGERDRAQVDGHENRAEQQVHRSQPDQAGSRDASNPLASPDGPGGARHRGFGPALGHEPQGSPEAQQRRDADAGRREDLGGQQGYRGGPDDEAQLVGDRLERERGVQPGRARQQDAPPGPDHRAQRRHGRARDRPRNEESPGGRVQLDGHDQGRGGDGKHREHRKQNAPLTTPVYQPGDLRRGERVPERADRRHGSGHAVLPGAGRDQQDGAEPEHRHRHPPDDARRREAPGPGNPEDIRVRPQRAGQPACGGAADGRAGVVNPRHRSLNPMIITISDRFNRFPAPIPRPVPAARAIRRPWLDGDMPSYDAFVLVSFGGPEGADDVMPFLANVTRGRNVPPERLAGVAEHYYAFGGGSPINQPGRAPLRAV